MTPPSRPGTATPSDPAAEGDAQAEPDTPSDAAASSEPDGASTEPDNPTEPDVAPAERAVPGGPGRVRARAERRAALVDERDFLLRSLDDLGREHEVGDVDDTDFAALEDDYTARAARVIRAIKVLDRQADADAARRRRGDGRAGTGPGRGPDRSGGRLLARRVAVAAGVLAFAGLAGVLVTQSSDERQSGETATGGIRETSRTQTQRAIGRAAEGDYEGAITALDEVLADQPSNVEALTYKGWFLFITGQQRQDVTYVEDGLVTLIEAATVDPEYPDAHAFLAVVFQRIGRPETALAELDRLDELDPPGAIRELVEGLRERVEADLAASGTGTPDAATPGS